MSCREVTTYALGYSGIAHPILVYFLGFDSILFLQQIENLQFWFSGLIILILVLLVSPYVYNYLCIPLSSILYSL